MTAADAGPVNLLTRWALWYAGKGWPVLPLHTVDDGGDCSCGGADCTSPGKHPRTAHGLSDASTEPRQVHAWWSRWPQANIGIRTGGTARLCVVDLDVHGDNGFISLPGLEGALGPLPDTARAKTGSAGEHRLYVVPNGATIRNSTGSNGGLAPGIDIRAEGGYIVAPPSRHALGTRYQWLPGHKPDEVPIAVLPGAWVKRLAAGPAAKPTVDPPAVFSGAAGSGRNNHLASLAGSMRRRGMSEPAIMAALATENDTFAEPLDAAEIRKIAGSVSRYEPALRALAAVFADDADAAPLPQSAAPDIRRSDWGNARRLIAAHGERLRFARGHRANSWFAWTGTHWHSDASGEAERAAKATVKAMYAELDGIADKDEREAQFKFIVRSENASRIRDLLISASTERELVTDIDAFDRDPWLVNLENGTYDVRAGNLRPHRRGDYITRLAPVTYEPGATCPHFLAYLARCMAGDAALVAYLQRAIGYSLTGRTSEQVMFVLWGAGANGKGTLLRMLRSLLGDYAQAAEPSTFTEKRGDRVSNDLAALRGSRLVEMSEGASGERLAEPLIKRLTGQDPLTCRFLFGEYFTYVPEFKLWYATNHKPVIHDAGAAMWRRVKLIPWKVVIPREEWDTDLDDKLRAELPGILNWALEGCADWYVRGDLGEPASVTEATAEYQDEMDELGPFLAECCLLDRRMTAASSALYGRYKHWAEGNQEKVLSAVNFGRKLGQRGGGIEQAKDGHGARLWRGLGLRGESGGHGE